MCRSRSTAHGTSAIPLLHATSMDHLMAALHLHNAIVRDILEAHGTNTLSTHIAS